MEQQLDDKFWVFLSLSMQKHGRYLCLEFRREVRGEDKAWEITSM